MESPYLELRDVTMAFKGYTAVAGINLSINKGEFVSLIGHSGCGKSTLLNMIAGLARPTAGLVTLDGRQITGPGPDRGVVFQQHALLPWLSVYRNVYEAIDSVFPGRGPSETQEKRERVERVLRVVGLWEHRHKHPGELSGGMRQRTAVARAFAIVPRLLLLDEPFGALDALTRARLQDELMGIVAEIKSTVVMVTHDVDEAVLLSDRIVMMTNGPAATIGDIVTVPLARPRDRLKLLADPLYLDCRRQVLEFLYKKQLRAAA